MCLKKFLNFTAITFLVLMFESVNAEYSTYDSGENPADSPPLPHLSNTERMKEIISSVYSKLEEIKKNTVELQGIMACILNHHSDKLKKEDDRGPRKPQLGDRANKACQNMKKQLYTEPHISGGDPVKLGEFPHMAALVVDNNIVCGGSLIADKFVLTAAHCINTKKKDKLSVYFGVTKFTDKIQIKDAVIRSVEKFYIHPEYRSPEKYNDIALIELTENVPVGSSISPACLHTNSTEQLIDDDLYVTGWGLKNTEKREHPDTLQKARIRVISLEACQNKYANFTHELSRGILKTQICTFDRNHEKDACKGDSGGPLSRILDNDFKKYSVVGVIAGGEGCASSMPGLYTRVSEYLEFIEKYVWI